MSDLDVLFPGVEVRAGSEVITVSPIPFGRLPKALALLKPVALALADSNLFSIDDGVISVRQNWPVLAITALADGPAEDLLLLLAHAINKPREWFDALPMDEGAALLKAVYEVNADFFQQRILPMFQPPKPESASASAIGATPSEGSSEPATAEPISTDTP